MKIKRIRAHYVRIPFDMGAPLQDMGGIRFPTMDHLLVEVTTDTGLTGWGEGFGHTIIPATQTALESYVAPWFIGKDATDIEGLHRQAAQAFHIFGRNGPVVYAHSAIDIALWDIAGKRAGLPLYQLLGGASRTHVRAYASLLRYGKPETVARICADRVRQGFRHIKLHEHDTAAVIAARDGAGTDTALMNDVNCPWSVVDAIEMERLYRKANLYWLVCEAALKPSSRRERTPPVSTTSRISSKKAPSTSRSQVSRKSAASRSCARLPRWPRRTRSSLFRIAPISGPAILLRSISLRLMDQIHCLRISTRTCKRPRSVTRCKRTMAW
jgi:hypothetical protein